ncbi:hypothetical protein EYS14_05195 [Alteromonadaceae bacterium M269]|nr:hypothetical protein EYS14_05195 [Alteromonadaceae bacterium M269]
MSIDKHGHDKEFSGGIPTLFEDTQYVILEEIGEGSFSVVFKAFNKKTKQLVAIKTLKDKLPQDNKEDTLNIQKEAELYAKLSHPNIVTLLDKGHINDIPFIVFEYVEGLSLKDELFTFGALSPSSVTDVMLQVLHALGHAHDHGIVHRDIKPANIMLTKQGNKTHVKLLDFGVGVVINDYPSSDKILGTPSYCAPEQIAGDTPTPKSDIYSWALVFLECLTTKTVISGSTLASIFQQHLSPKDIQLPQYIASHPLSAILKPALKKNTERRSSSATNIAEKLACIDTSNLDTLRPKATTHSQDLIPVNHSSFDSTMVINDENLIDTFDKPHAATVMCVTLSLNSYQSEPTKSNYQLSETQLEALYEEKKNLCISVAQKYGGELTGRLVDTLLFHFGSPETMNVDSRMCAKAALELTNTLNSSIYLNEGKVKISCTFYIGIHSGLSWKRSQQFPQGELPRVAMTLAKEADENQILCSQFTHNILTSHAQFEANFNSTDDSIIGQPSYALLGEHAQTEVDSLRFTSNLMHFVGREYELGKLESLIDKVSSPKAGHKRCAHIHGEGGIGKSRLIAELCIRKGYLNIASMQCTPENQKRPLNPILNLVKRQYDLDTDNKSQGTQKLHKALKKYSGNEPEKSITTLYHWLGVEPHSPLSTTEIPIKESKKRLFDLLIYLLCSASKQQVKKRQLYILDDLHWVDSTTLEFIAAMIASSEFQHSGQAILTSSRQGLPPELYGQITTVLKINRLNDKEAYSLITASFNDQQITEPMADFILHRTNGIPLFIIEFVRMLKENQWTQHLNGKVSLVQTHAIPLIPYNLRDSLEQRLQELTCDRKVIQFASAIGEEFDYDALKYSMGPRTLELNMTLDELLKRDVIRIKRRGGKKNFVFKHALLRDAAFDSMPYSLRLEAQELICYSRQEQAQNLNSEIDAEDKKENKWLR